MEIADLADLLHETAEHHDPYEETHAAHNAALSERLRRFVLRWRTAIAR
jgi:hypothetical protein